MPLFDFFQSRSLRTRNIWKRLFLIGVLVLIAGFFLNGVVELHKKLALIKAEQAKKQAELQKLIQERERLEKEIAFLQSQSALEREAKARLNFKKPGEEVVIVVPDEKPALQAIASVPYTPTFWERVREFFTKLFLP